MYERYAALRNERGLTDYRVAKNADITYPVFSRWKSGKTTPRLETLQKIAKVLGVETGALIDGQGTA